MFSFITRGIAVLGFVLLAPVPAAMHTRLIKAEPGIGQTVAESPKQIRLWFSETPVLAFTAVKLEKADSTVIATIVMAATDDASSLAGPVPTPLAPGSYIVAWRTAANDGHPARGEYRFTYRGK